MTSTQASTDLKDKVAVITGAASGIGLALALEAAERGMKVALADIGQDKLDAALRLIEQRGVAAIACKTDVRSLDDLVALRDEVHAQLGDPWLLVNNAGITKLAMTWDHSPADWARMFDINVGGVVNGLLAFLPGLRERNAGYIVNTSSAAGVVTIPAAAAYTGSKHAVVGISETLYRELAATHSQVGISVLCPALVKTAILGTKVENGKEVSSIESSHALEPEDVARAVFDALLRRRFWIMTHAQGLAPYMRARVEQMIAQTNPDAASVDPDVARSSTAATGVDFT